ncbi:hypothetical protein H072_4527 [Dactylellina haptotyla CBS 200.50]|uniref:Ig-like domain-containing protein n=1 Tax=Dactylellina haptotyla (strain CBS 200.50) TaxID=1284197 RepID=S8AEU0_DACHA|nr:hypothetical protein H072_4527 [Dactylellina haptotyla CBS 200.50]
MNSRGGRTTILLLSLLDTFQPLLAETISVQPNATHSTLSHCGPDCAVAYTVVEVSWAPTVSTLTAYGGPSDVASSSYIYSQYWAQFSPELVLGSVATDWRTPYFTATCCDTAYYIASGVTAQFSTTTGDPEICTPTEIVFTGQPVGTVQPSAPTSLAFLQHDCGVSTTVIKTVLTQVTISAATPNPPTGTADGQKTWWDDSDTITILVSPTPTQFTISSCSVGGNCQWSVGTMNLVWEATTITISGNASELASQEAELSTSVRDTEDWVDATSGWDGGLGATAPCCATSIYLDDDLIIDYDGYCPTTVLTGYNTVLPQDIAYSFIDGDLAHCNINIGGGIASTKTAVYVAKLTADVDGGTTTTTPPATKEPDTIPTSTTTSIISKDTEVIHSTTTPRPTTTRPRTTSRQQQQSPSSGQSSRPQPPISPPNQSSNPNNPVNPPATNPNNNPVNTALPVNTPGDTQNGGAPGVSTNLVIPGTLAPQPSLSTIFGTSPIEITTTDAAGSQTVISTFTTVPVGTAVNIITTDSEGNSITTRVTLTNPAGSVENSSRTTILTVTTRQGTGFTVETVTSIIADETGTASLTSEEASAPTDVNEPGPSESSTSTGSPSQAASQNKRIPIFELISGLLTTGALLFL